MNVERFYSAIDLVMKLDVELELGQRLQRVADDLNHVATNPGHGGHQTNLVARLNELAGAVEQMQARITPEVRHILQQVGGESAFDKATFDGVRNWIADNNMTPAIALESLNRLISERTRYLEILAMARNGLKALGIRGESVPPDTAELSVLLPRELFKNSLEPLAKELKVLDGIIRPFSEIATSSVEPVQVDQISSSDPTFIFGMNLDTIKLIGEAVTWIITTLRGAQEITKAQREAKKIGMPDPIIEAYDKHREEYVQKSIAEKALALVAQSNALVERQQELQLQTIKAMTDMAARIERGARIEVLVGIQTNQDDAEKSAKLATLRTLSAEISYPQLEGEPILQLTAGDDAMDKLKQ
jgi:hypothetical protein